VVLSAISAPFGGRPASSGGGWWFVPTLGGVPGDTRARRPTRGRTPRGASGADQPFGQELIDALMGPATFGAGQMNFA
jgi:hypothetical protein